MEAEPTTLAAIRTSLLSLADYVASAQLRIPRPETPRVERTRDEVAWAIREYLVPRLDDPLAPAVAVVAGPGGTGKSAILNAIARRPVSDSGVMRPTTTEPIVWGPRSRPESEWRVFLHRLREQTGAELDVVMGDDPLTEHVIFVDTPPVDLVRADGRIPALEALGLADICIFVTSASRYADASGWMYLEAARRRGVPILHVINRLSQDPEVAEEVLIDYVARLHGRDLLMEPDTSLVFPVVSGEIDATTGGPSAAAVGALRGELAELAHSEFRSAIINQTVLATTHAVAQRARRVGAELAVEVQERADFDEAVVTAYREQSRALAADLEAGRFAELADAESWGLAAADLTGIVTRRAGVAAQDATQSWEARGGGRELLGSGGEGLRRHGQDTAYEAQRVLEQWYTLVGDRAAAAGKRGKLWRSTRRRVQRQVWPQVLDPERAMNRVLTRRYGAKASDLVGSAREDLADALTAALAADAERFERFLGPQPDSDVLREIETRAEWIEALVEDEVELVPIGSPRTPKDDGGVGSEQVDAESDSDLGPDPGATPADPSSPWEVTVVVDAGQSASPVPADTTAETSVAEYVVPGSEEPNFEGGLADRDPGETPPVDAWGEEAEIVPDGVTSAVVFVQDDQVEPDGEGDQSEADELDDQVGSEDRAEPEEGGDQVESEEPHDSDGRDLTGEPGEFGDGAEEPPGLAGEREEDDDA
jgi:hypothetical protein